MLVRSCIRDGAASMTTSHRPTWAPAKGHEEQGGSRAFGPSKQFSSRDIAAHTKLKYRREYELGANERGVEAAGDGDALVLDMRADLLRREREAARKRMAGMSGKDIDEYDEEVQRKMLEAERRLMPNDADKDFEDDDDEDRANDATAATLDYGGVGGGVDLASDDSESDEDEDDTAALLAELEKIKKERAAAAAAAAAAAEAEEEKKFEEEAVAGNPLLDIRRGGGPLSVTDDGTTTSAAFGLKRRWDDDVVFRNQTRDEPKQQRRFINDTIRSDFHRRFLNKYIK